MANINRGNVQAFQEKAGSTNGLYLKGKDFEDARRIRPIMWLRDGQPTDVLLYLEGWHVVKQKNDKGQVVEADKPIRLNMDEVIPETINWKKSSYKGGPLKLQLPKATASFVCWDYTTKSIKIASFSQQSVTGFLADLCSPTTKDGAQNEMYEEDLSKIDLVILKGVKDNDPYKVTIKPLKNQDLDPECLKELADFHWSWDAFMACENPTEPPAAITYDDVVDVVYADEPKQAEKPAASKTTSKQAPAKEEKTESTVVDAEYYNYNEKWAEVKTPAGKILGNVSTEDLEAFKSKLEEMNKTKNNPLYDAICSGLKDKQDLAGQTSGEEVLF